MKRLFAAVLLALFVASSAHATTTIAPGPDEVRLALVGEVVEILRAHLAENPDDYAAWANLGGVHANVYARGTEAVELARPRKEGEAPSVELAMPPIALAKRLESVSEPRAAHLAQAVRCFQKAVKGEGRVKEDALVGLGYALWESRDRFAQIPWPLETEAFDVEAKKHAAESEWWGEQALSVLQQLNIPDDPATALKRDYESNMGTNAPACWILLQILEQRTTLSEEDKKKLESFRKISKGYRGNESAFAAELPPQPQELASLYPATPAGMATAELYLRAVDATAYLLSTGSDLPYIGQGNMKDFRGKPLSQELVSKIPVCLDAHKETFRLLDEAARGTECRYPVDLSKGLLVGVPHLSPLRNVARLLAMRSLYASVTGDSATVARSLTNCFAVSESLRSEPVAISQILRVGIVGIAIATLNETQNRIDLAPADMLALQEKLASLEGLDGLKAAMLGERFALIEAVEMPFDTAEYKGLSPASIARMEKERPKSDEVSKLFAELIATIELPAAEAMEDCGRINDAYTLKLPNICRLIQSFHRMHAMLRGAQIALAVDRYSRTNAGPPETLEELVPVYLRTIPLDPFDEQPMRYRLEEGGFLVYSVGDNLVDDNGLQDVRTDQETKRYADIPYRVGVAAVSSEAEEGEPRW
jgi:hypothetical protein